jgi:hypothetical protein
MKMKNKERRNVIGVQGIPERIKIQKPKMKHIRTWG